MFVDSLQATFSRDDWCKINGTIKGTGKVTDNVVEESITAKDDATSLTLAANAVEGADATTRLQNVQRIRVQLASGEWTDVAYTAVSDDTPAQITIESLNANDINDVIFRSFISRMKRPGVLFRPG
jgi:hypothetical protein